MPPKEPASAPSPDVDERVVHRLQAKLASGRQPVFVLEEFLADPDCGGCPADAEAVRGWAGFVGRHRDTFELTNGKYLMLGLVPKPKPAAGEPQPTAGSASTASSAPEGGVGRLMAPTPASTMSAMHQSQSLLLRAIEGCAAFPVSLKVLQLAMTNADVAAGNLLKHLGYGPQLKSSFRDFVELTLRTFPERLQDYCLQEIGPTTMLARVSNGPNRTVVPAVVVETVEDRVVRRLRRMLQPGPKTITGIRAFLGDPANGGCKADTGLLADWKTFVLQHADIFSFDESGRLPLISLRPGGDPPRGGPSPLPPHRSQPGQERSATSLVERTQADTRSGASTAAELAHSDAAAVPAGPVPVATGEPSPAVPNPPPPPSQLLVKLVGPEAAAKLTQRTAAPTPAEAAGTAERARGTTASEGGPAPQSTAAADLAALVDVSRHLCDVLRAQPTFPVELKAVARQLDQRCPGVKAALEGGGFPPTHRGFADFVRRTIGDHPGELCGVELAMGDNGLWEVVRGNGPTPRDGSSAAPSLEPPAPLPGPPSPPPSPSPVPPSHASPSPASATSALSSSPPTDDLPPSTAVPQPTTPTGRYCHVTDRVALDQATSDLRALYEDCVAGRPSPAIRHLALAWEELLDEPFALCGRLWLAAPRQVYAVETEPLGADVVCSALQPFLGSQHLHKVVHSSASTISLRRLGFQPVGVLDTELAYEHLTGELLGTVGDVCRLCGVPVPAAIGTGLMDQEALTVSAVAACYDALVAKLGADLEPILRVSEQRTKATKAVTARLAWFDARRQCRLTSSDLLLGLRPADALPTQPLLQDVYGVQQVLGLLPPLFQPKAVTVAPALTSIVLDLGRRPEAFCGDRQVPLADGPVVVTLENLVHVVAAVGLDRLQSRSCTLPGTLHRVSVIRNPQGAVIGLTVRIVRPVVGLAALLSDVLLGQPDRSVLVLGESGSGKTSIVRDVACLLSGQHHTVVVDTFNDVGGDGDLPHPSLGKARRLRVPPGADQQAVMEECLRNHRPRVMVVDEIGREAEVEVARIAKRRGVRLVAGVAGTLEQLLHDRPLAGLLGGVETVVSPDGAPITQRVALPLFECIVRVRRGPVGDYMVIHNVAQAMDLLLQGRPCPAGRRVADPTSGFLWYTPGELTLT